MSDNSVDPSGNTEAFRAFTETTPAESADANKRPAIIGGIVVAVAVVIVLFVLLTR